MLGLAEARSKGKMFDYHEQTGGGREALFGKNLGIFPIS
jgi:hypothetical protein